jgi:membrane fusion protein, multidrug efflux system
MQYLRYPKILILLLSCHALAAQEQKVEKPLAVIVQSVAQFEFENTILALGSLRANDSVILTAKANKTISHIYFVDGQQVSKGSVLVDMSHAEESALVAEESSRAAEAKKRRDRLKSLSLGDAVSAATLDQAQGDYETSSAHLAALQARLSDLQITAPFSGVIGLRNISLGSLVTPGQEIATLNDDRKMKLDFTVPSVYLSSLHIGLPLSASSEDLHHKIIEGSIVSIDNKIDEATRSIKVRAMLDNMKQELKQGMLMNVELHADKRVAFAISEAALVPMGSNNFVYLLQRKNAEKNSSWVAEKRQVNIGARFRGRVEILSGLVTGDKVVTHGLQKIHDGQVITILAEQNNSASKTTESLSELLQQKKQ